MMNKIVIIYEDMGKGCRYLKMPDGRMEEIPSEEEHLYRGLPVSHGYITNVTMENVLWQDGLNEEPTIEDELMGL